MTKPSPEPTLPFPEPTLPAGSQSEVLLRYLDYFRSRVIERIDQLPEPELRRSRLVSGWTPLELVKHLTFVEMRWLEWGFAGRTVENPWGDNRGDRWFVPESETRSDLVEGLGRQGRDRATSWRVHRSARSADRARGGTVPCRRLSSASFCT